jgi:methyltransferase (TIGR00027 family)
MEANKASITAELMARNRAAEHLLVPAERRICDDPYAHHFISAEGARNLNSPWRRTIRRLIFKLFYPGVYNAIVARVRFLDDRVRDCLAAGLEQLVILGAGYDSRAYRFNGLAEQVQVFEVDHPATQAVKKTKIETLFNPVPGHVHYVPAALDRDDLAEKLAGAGYHPEKRSLFIMEGLLMYLPPPFVDKILAFIRRNAGPGSAVAFDYLPPSMVDGTVKAREGRAMMKGVRKWGEPFRFGLNVSEAEGFMRFRGFKDILNIHAPDLKQTLFKGNPRGDDISGVFGFIFAVVDE